MTDQLDAALVKAQAALLHASKSGKNPHYQTRYATVTDVIDVLREPLAQNGLAFVQEVRKDDVVTIMVHESGERREASWVPIINQKNDMQGLKSAVTYARRIGLTAAFGIADADDDANEADAKAPISEEKMRVYLACVRANWDIISAIKEAVQNDDLTAALNAKNDLSEDDQHTLWRAPTRGIGSIFSTEERAFFKGRRDR